MDLKESTALKPAKRHPWELARAEFILSLLKERLYLNPEARTVLDAGCGDAYLVSFLASRFPKLDFIALDNVFTDEDLERLNRESLPNIHFYNDLSRISAKADIVLLLDVLEHVEDEQSLLGPIGSGPGSRAEFIVTVPAWKALFSRHDKILGHYRRYRAKSLAGVLEIAGIKVSSGGYFFSWLLPLRFLQLILESLWITKVKAETQTAVWKGGELKTKVFSAMLLADAKASFYINKFFKIKVPGLSAYAVGRRNS